MNLIGHFASKDLEALLPKTVGGVRTHQVGRVKSLIESQTPLARLGPSPEIVFSENGPAALQRSTLALSSASASSAMSKSCASTKAAIRSATHGAENLAAEGERSRHGSGLSSESEEKCWIKTCSHRGWQARRCSGSSVPP